MNRFLKTFLLWLMIAALPIQGIAAVVKATCGPKHHAMSSMSAVSSEHQHPDGSVHHHHHDASDRVSTVAVSVALTDDASNDSNSNHVHKASTCSACAACCVGATAPPPSINIPSVFRSAQTLVIPSVISFAGITPASLERPPRHFSA